MTVTTNSKLFGLITKGASTPLKHKESELLSLRSLSKAEGLNFRHSFLEHPKLVANHLFTA
jgi:hypothetical protein